MKVPYGNRFHVFVDFQNYIHFHMMHRRKGCDILKGLEMSGNVQLVLEFFCIAEYDLYDIFSVKYFIQIT